MAAPSYATDLTDIYTDTENFSTVGGGRVTAAETDDYIQGNNCWSHDPFSSGIEGGVHDTVTAETITSGDAVYIWTKCDVAATLATHTAGGVQALIGDATTALKCFYVAGSDDYQYGGWKCYPVDPTKTASTNIGSPSGVWDHFGVRWNVPSTGAAKGYPMKIDAMRHGKSLEVTAGDSGTPATWDDTAAHDATGTRQWGILQPTATGAELQGHLYWGTATTAVYSRDSNRAVTIIDTEWTDTDFTQIIFPHASNDVVWDNIGVLALGTNNRGIIDVTADGSITWTNSVFEGIDTTTLLASSTFDGSKWLSCNAVSAGGASMLNCKILTPTVVAGSHALLWNVASDPNGELDGMEFSKGTNDHAAIELGTNTPTTISLSGQTYTGFNTSTGSNPTASTGANDCAIYNNSGKTITINIVGDGQLPSVRNGAGATTVVVLSKSYTLTNLQNPSEVTILDRDVELEDVDTGGTPAALSFGNAAATERAGQSFQVTTAGKVERIRLNLRKVGSPTDAVNIRLVAGVPGSTLTSTSVNIDGTDLTTSFVEFDVDLNGKYSLATATTYGIEIQRTGSVDAANYYQVEYDSAGFYASGTRYNYNAGWSTASGDLLFYVMEAASDNELYHVESVTTGTTTYTHGGVVKNIEVLVSALSYKQVILVDDIGATDESVPILQVPDLVYSA